jgi:hypothetical protein
VCRSPPLKRPFKSLGQTGAGLAADGNGDNTVDQSDYGVWCSHFGQIAGSGTGVAALAAVPEPASPLLLKFGAVQKVEEHAE